MKDYKTIFINKAILKHSNKYDYSKLEYLGSQKKVLITCPEHGDFFQGIYDHLKGSGCPSCVGLKKLTNTTFIKKALEKHGEHYDYSNVNYINYETGVDIICPTHGLFNQTPHNHLAGKGCPNCKNSKNETIIKLFLEKHKIKFTQEFKFSDCVDTLPLPFDFYLPEHNTCIEYDGEQHFKPKVKFGGEEGFKDRVKKDLIKTEYCLNNGINLIRINYKENTNNRLQEHLKLWKK